MEGPKQVEQLTNVQVGGVWVPIIEGALIVEGIQCTSSLLPDALPLLTPFLLPAHLMPIHCDMSLTAYVGMYCHILMHVLIPDERHTSCSVQSMPDAQSDAKSNSLFVISCNLQQTRAIRYFLAAVLTDTCGQSGMGGVKSAHGMRPKLHKLTRSASRLQSARAKQCESVGQKVQKLVRVNRCSR